jgi:hypothetical protein
LDQAEDLIDDVEEQVGRPLLDDELEAVLFYGASPELLQALVDRNVVGDDDLRTQLLAEQIRGGE